MAVSQSDPCHVCHNLTPASRPALDIDGFSRRNLEAQKAQAGQTEDPAALDYKTHTTSTALRISAASGRCRLCSVLWSGLTEFLDPDELKKDGVVVKLNLWIWIPLPVQVIWGSDFFIEFFTDCKDGTTAELGTYMLVSNPSLQDQSGLWPTFGRARKVAEFSNSDECFDVVKHWTEDCDSSHPPCTTNRRSPLPTRVVDVRSPGEDPYLYLSHGEIEPYLCLSHCWGEKAIIRTTKATIFDWRRRIPWQLLSCTFRDVVSIARRLKIQYVWIDSLCIIQDDAQDWEIESAPMAAIYQYAYLNVAATHAANGDGGCFHRRQHKGIDCRKLVMLDYDGHPCNVFVRQQLFYHNMVVPYEEDLVQNPLHFRAWVFQERLLSPRNLHFTNHEMFWECRHRSRCECSSIDQGFSALTHETFKRSYEVLKNTDHPLEINEFWRRLLMQYSRLHLTYASDRLPAISGIAKQFQEKGLGTYLAGLWSDDLPRGLLWRSKSYQVCRRPRKYRAPSWSWASIEGAIEYGMTNRRPVTETCHIEVLQAHCALTGKDPTGNVSAGNLHLRGSVVQADFGMPSTSNEYSKQYPTLRRHGVISMLYLDVPVELQMDASPSVQLYCLRIPTANFGMQVPLPREHTTTTSLVLEHLRDTENVYKRIGLLSQDDPKEVGRWYQNAEESTIIIE